MSDTHTGTTPTWRYNKRLHIVTHEPRTCNACKSWAFHYLEEILANEPSLRTAEQERDAAITRRILSRERNSLLEDNAALHKQLNTLKKMLEECNTQMNQAQLALKQKNAQVIELTEQLATFQLEKRSYSTSEGRHTVMNKQK
jgi:hypothetical protein